MEPLRRQGLSTAHLGVERVRGERGGDQEGCLWIFVSIAGQIYTFVVLFVVSSCVPFAVLKFM